MNLLKLTVQGLKDQPGYYVSNTGNVYSANRGSIRKLKEQPTDRGYLRVSINGKHCKIHRLVAKTFIGSIEGLTINHIDAVKDNNHVDNLEIVTLQQNYEHAVLLGLTKSRCYLKEEDISYIRSCGKHNKVLSRELGVSPDTIKDVKGRRTWKHLL